MDRWVFEIPFLIVKDLTGSLSEDDRRVLEAWKSNHRRLYEKLRNPEEAGKHAALMSAFPVDSGWENLDRRIRRMDWYEHMLIAASFLLPMAIALLIGYNIMNDRNMPTLAMLEVVTGRGVDSTVVLPDGSTVQLNALSRLSYPEQFSESNREVRLEGEAFFDVTSSSIPFTVMTESFQVQVLGTSFDVSAYAGKEARAILVDGSVKVKCADADSCILCPGQMASIPSDGSCLSVRDADVSALTSWKDGKICFRDERLDDILQTLSRWYDFSYEYSDPALRDLRFGCYVDRCEDISTFFGLLSRTGRISVDAKERHYVVHLCVP